MIKRDCRMVDDCFSKYMRLATKMKIPEKTINKLKKIKKKVNKIQHKTEQVLVVAQEIKFARLLSGNEKKTRDRVLKALKKWLLNCFEKGYEFKEDDFTRVWKGLFYAMWMSDKPLIQEDLCEKISEVLDLFPASQLRAALLMFKAGLRILATEWYGLDQHRTDKFLMLVRRYLRASLRCLQRRQWSVKSCKLYASTLAGTDGILALKTPHYARNALSMLLHVLDCYLEEIAKVSNGDIPEASLVELLRPVCEYMCGGEAPSVCAGARRLLTALLRQSDAGLQYQQATAAWQKMGCPEGGPDALELVSDSEDDDEEQQNGDDDSVVEIGEKPLDPRAGRVDVELPSLPVPARELASILRGELARTHASTQRRVRICLERFEKLAANDYPLRLPLPVEEESAPPVKPKKAAHSLHALEKKLITASDELALRGLSRKHRKRLLAKSRSGTSIVEELDTANQKLSNTATNGWQIEETKEPAAKKQKPNPSNNNKENKKRKHDGKLPSEEKKRKINGNVDGKPDTVSKDGADVGLKANASSKHKKVENGHTKVENNKNKKVENGHAKVEINKNKKVENGHAKIENKKIEHKDKTKHAKSTEKNNKPLVTKTKVSQEHNNKNTNVEKSSDVTVKDKNKKGEVQNVKTNESNKKSTETQNVKKNENKHEKNAKPAKNPTLVVNKVKQFQKQINKFDKKSEPKTIHYNTTPKKVKFVLKNNSMQQPVDYYKSVRQSPNIPFDGSKKPTKTNLKPSTPSPINPFFKKKLRLK
uniref:SFRICE_007120 n=1 Tax=Spodoptera frugiperda TaxID=7108 RepID=A0A2H1VAI4_SPOFR